MGMSYLELGDLEPGNIEPGNIEPGGFYENRICDTVCEQYGIH